MRAAGRLTIMCVAIIAILIVVKLRNNDQGEVTDHRQGMVCVKGLCSPTYSLKINGRWHPVSLETYGRCDIGERHPTCKTR